jgi:hypothetical protein
MVVLVALLAGCQTLPSASIRREAPLRETYLVPGNYQAVYREILHRARAALGSYPEGLRIWPQYLEEEVWTDKQAGSLALMVRKYLPEAKWVLDFSARGESATIVQTYYAHHAYAPEVRGWLAASEGVRSEGTP